LQLEQVQLCRRRRWRCHKLLRWQRAVPVLQCFSSHAPAAAQGGPARTALPSRRFAPWRAGTARGACAQRWPALLLSSLWRREPAAHPALLQRLLEHLVLLQRRTESRPRIACQGTAASSAVRSRLRGLARLCQRSCGLSATPARPAAQAAADAYLSTGRCAVGAVARPSACKGQLSGSRPPACPCGGRGSLVVVLQ